MIAKLALKNIFSRKSSIVIVLFIAFAVAMLLVTNSIFDSTENGIEETFVSSFTGDLIIRPKTDVSLSLFGDESPVTGKLSKIPTLFPFNDISEVLKSENNISSFLPQISGQAAMEKDSARAPANLFGINGKKYLQMMSSISITDGEPFEENQKGLMLSQKFADELNAKKGDTIQFTVVDGVSFRIRAVPLTAIYNYPIENETLNKIALIDPATLRDLMDVKESFSTSVKVSEEIETLLAEEDIDNLFSDAEDIEVSQEFKNDEQILSEAIENDITIDETVEPVINTSWNFIVCKVENPKKIKAEIKRLNKIFKDNEWPVEAVNWRNAAGSSAMYLYLLRMIFNIGILIILFAGFIVVNNTLVINVLDRTKEIGTMRAIGATKSFVSLECMAETIFLAFFAGLFGILLGILGDIAIRAANISFSNGFLIQLFGSGSLTPIWNFSNITKSFFVAVILGLIAWVYPVNIALKTSPVQAMVS